MKYWALSLTKVTLLVDLCVVVTPFVAVDLET
jgi:hypothetical protein